MRRALEFIELNPGCTKREALDAAGVYYTPFGGAPDSVDRLFYRGLIYNGGRRNRYALYPASDRYRPIGRAPVSDQPTGMWAPGHP